jgi:UDP-N-acetylmuramoyl-tripeptide--D-alanyl-D-alanine ligase
MTVSMEETARWLGADSYATSNAIVTGWSTDTRTIQAGDLYFALRGPNHDGHDYTAQAIGKGAIAAVVDHPIPDVDRLLIVDDTLAALQRLAHQARIARDLDVIAVTGSAGKTTTKDVVAQLLSVRFPVGKTVGNFNNHIGVPLSILRLPDEARFAVLEMGMNHAGEIRDLCAIACPRVGVVTNVGYAHVEFFESIEGVAAAKRELIDSLPPDGIAILNADDERVFAFRRHHKGRTITYGISPQADIRATEIRDLTDGARFIHDGLEFHTPLSGLHGVLNTLAGIATADAYGIQAKELVEAARFIPQGKMRGERVERNGIIIINDSYNANPEAARGMLDVLAATAARRRIAVLGEMLELGAMSEALHRSVGAHAAKLPLDLFVGVRGAAHAMLEEAVSAGMPAAKTLFFQDAAEAGRALKELARPGDAVLFKGSRGVRVELALEKMLEGRD